MILLSFFHRIYESWLFVQWHHLISISTPTQECVSVELRAKWRQNENENLFNSHMNSSRMQFVSLMFHYLQLIAPTRNRHSSSILTHISPSTKYKLQYGNFQLYIVNDWSASSLEPAQSILLNLIQQKYRLLLVPLCNDECFSGFPLGFPFDRFCNTTYIHFIFFFSIVFTFYLSN